MKIRFFLLGTEKHSSSARFSEELKQIFASHISDDGDIQSFDNIRAATTDIAKAVSDSHALVFIADTEQYAATKLMLGKAFGFEMSCDTALLKKACEAFEKDPGEEDYEFSVAHAFVPKNAKNFVLPDGLFAGFSVANGNQTIILIPLQKGRTSVLVSSQVIPYLNAAYKVNIGLEALKKYNADILMDVLEKHGASLAVAGTNTAGFLKEYLACDERAEALVQISPIAEKRGTLQPVDYVVNLSITASELMSCPYSVAISNAFYTGDSPESEKVVYLAVSNERETAVREIHSVPGEDIPSFLGRCCGDLCVFTAEVIDADDAFHSDIKTRENAAVKRYKIAISAVAAVIVALIVFIGVYFTSNNYTIGTWYDNFMAWIFPAGNPLDDLFENKLPGGGEEEFADEVTQDDETASEEDGEKLSTEEAFAEEYTDEGSSEKTTAEKISGEEAVAEENTEDNPSSEETSDGFILVG